MTNVNLTPFYEWANRWFVPPGALNDLLVTVLGTSPDHTLNIDDFNKSESAVMQAVRIKASQQGRRMWRNNCGVAFREDGVPIRFGLGNDSIKTHDHYRSSDLIGITPIKIEPSHIGQRIGVFTSWEIKRPDWVFKSTDKHSVCQYNWNKIIVSLGGDARFITNESQI